MLKDDTLKKLEARQQELAELFLAETDTEPWRDLSTADKRGDVYWLKKNAAQTIGLVVRIQSVMNLALQVVPGEQPAEETEALAKKAERDAVSLIARVRKHRADA